MALWLGRAVLMTAGELGRLWRDWSAHTDSIPHFARHLGGFKVE